MRVLLDECVPRPLTRHLTDHWVRTIGDMNWAGKRNGELLKAMQAADFDALITVDRNLPFQQNIRAAGIAVVVLTASTNRLEDLVPLVEKLRTTLNHLKRGELVEISA